MKDQEEENLFELIKQEQNSDQEDCLRSHSNTPDESSDKSTLTDTLIVNNSISNTPFLCIYGSK